MMSRMAGISDEAGSNYRWADSALYERAGPASAPGEAKIHVD